MYIIANVGPLADSPFANVKTEAELLAVTGDLMENSNVTTQTEDNLWMSGVNDVSFLLLRTVIYMVALQFR